MSVSFREPPDGMRKGSAWGWMNVNVWVERGSFVTTVTVICSLPCKLPQSSHSVFFTSMAQCLKHNFSHHYQLMDKMGAQKWQWLWIHWFLLPPAKESSWITKFLLWESSSTPKKWHDAYKRHITPCEAEWALSLVSGQKAELAFLGTLTTKHVC